jgi:hypothetical protein
LLLVSARRLSHTVNVRTLVVTTATVTALASAAVLHSFAADVVEIRVRGHFFAAPATVQITVAVEPDAANRTLRIEADGDRLFRSTEVNLDGQSDKKLHTVEFKNLPAGSYELRAEVLTADKVRGMATQELVVAGAGAPD